MKKMTETVLNPSFLMDDEYQKEHLLELLKEQLSYEWGERHLKGWFMGLRAMANFSPAVEEYLMDLEDKYCPM